MLTPSSLHEYLRLCGAPHKAIYVARSVMLSCFTGTSFRVVYRDSGPHKKRRRRTGASPWESTR